MNESKVYVASFKKAGKEWEETYRSYDQMTVLERLSAALLYKHVFKSPTVKRQTDKCNYDGTRTLTTWYDFGGFESKEVIVYKHL